jgi:ABC-type amino acid transport substrate-binding protein
MKRTPGSTVLLLAMLLILPAANLFAQESEGTLEKIARTGEFLIGYRTDSSPLSFNNAQGNPAGYSVELCRRIAVGIKEHLGKEIEAKFVPISADERISAVVDGKIDIECGSTTITLSRQERVDFSLPTFVTGASVVSLKGSGILGLSDLSGKKIGVAKDTTTVDKLRNYLDQAMIDAKIVIVDNRIEGWNKLNEGGIAAMASDQIVLIGLIMEAPNPQRYSLASEIFSYEPYGFAIRRNDADFRLVVDRALAQLYRSGGHADIFYKWIGQIGISVPPILAAMYQLNAIPE